MSENKKGFYGWILLVVVGFMFLCSSAFIMVAGSVVNPLMLKDPSLNLNGAMLGMGFTVFILCQGIPAPLIGQFIEKFGQKRSFIVGGCLLIIGGLMMVYLVKNSIMYIISFGVVLSIGAVMAGQLTMQSTVSNWFAKNRAMAMSIAMVIGAIGSFIAPHIVTAIIKSSGGAWQNAWYFISILGVVVIILAALFVKNKPSDIGQFPDGIDPNTAQASTVAAKESRVYKNPNSIGYKDALKTKNFWFIALAGTGAFCGYNLAVSQGVLHFTSLGFDPATVTGAVAIMGIANLLGKLSVGPLGDRIEPPKMFGIFLAILAVGILLSAKASTPAIAYLYYICTGFGFGGCNTVLPVTIGNYFGTKFFPKNMGTIMMICALISACIPVMGGAIYDATGTGTISFFIVGAVVVVGVICAFLIRAPKRS